MDVDYSVGPYSLYDYQRRMYHEIRDAVSELKSRKKSPHIIVQAPCASGKTIVQAFVAKQAGLRGKKFMFIVAGRSLVSQTSEEFMECGVPHGVLMAGSQKAIEHDFASHNTKSLSSCQSIIASRETYGSRVLNRKIVDGLNLDVICVDEGHNGCSGTVYRKIFDENPDKVILLFTATPIRGNGYGLGPPFQKVIHGVTHEELLAGGFIVPPVCFGPKVVDMKGVHIDKKTGDYVQSEAEARWNTDELVGDLLRDWRKYGEDRPTVVFAQGVEHSKHIAANFSGHGIAAVHIDANTDISERKRYYDELARGSLKIISNYGVMAYGVNVREVGCCVLARAMASLSVFLQTTGRVFRSCKSVYWMNGGAKPDARIIDHGANIKKHGWPQADRWWPLDDEVFVDDFTKQKLEEDGKKEIPLLHCVKCGAEWQATTGNICPNCGYKKQSLGKAPEFDGQELGRIKKSAAKPVPRDDQKVWNQCLGQCANTGRSLSQAIRIFERKSRKSFSKADIIPITNYESVKKELDAGKEWKQVCKIAVSKLLPNFVRGGGDGSDKVLF